jgi:glycosyltransferase involved in cell wall biosynthesis
MKNLVCLLSGDADLWLLKLCPELCVGPEHQSGVKIIDLGFAMKLGRPLHILLCMAVLAWLKVFRSIDTVWVNGYPEIALMPWARLIGCKAIATRHLTLISDKPRWHWIRSGWRVHFIYELLAPTADKIVCVSEAVASSLEKCVRREKLIVIPNWIPALPEPVSFSENGAMTLRLLFVGRLIPHKGASLILDAIRQLDAADGLRGISLTVVGDGKERETLEREAKNMNVEFAGFWTDTSSFYKRADVFVNPTMGPEGLPLVSLDAMSYGLPCIFSDISVHKEISRNGTSALLFESGNSEGLRKKIELLLTSPQLIHKYGRLAREMVEANHGPDYAHRRYVEELGL